MKGKFVCGSIMFFFFVITAHCVYGTPKGVRIYVVKEKKNHSQNKILTPLKKISGYPLTLGIIERKCNHLKQ